MWAAKNRVKIKPVDFKKVKLLVVFKRANTADISIGDIKISYNQATTCY